MDTMLIELNQLAKEANERHRASEQMVNPKAPLQNKTYLPLSLLIIDKRRFMHSFLQLKRRSAKSGRPKPRLSRRD